MKKLLLRILVFVGLKIYWIIKFVSIILLSLLLFIGLAFGVGRVIEFCAKSSFGLYLLGFLGVLTVGVFLCVAEVVLGYWVDNDWKKACRIIK